LLQYGQDADPEGQLRFQDWLRCYAKAGMDNLVDSAGRTIWFSGKVGKLAPKTAKKRGLTKAKKTEGKDENDEEISKQQNAVKRAHPKVAKKASPKTAKSVSTKSESAAAKSRRKGKG